MVETEMTRDDLRWLRDHMESADKDIKDAAESVHRQKMFFLPDYANVKNVELTGIEFYAQGILADIQTAADEYRHVHYVIKKSGKAARTLYAGDINHGDSAEPKTTRSAASLRSMFFNLFLNKLDELFASYVYLPETSESSQSRIKTVDNDDEAEQPEIWPDIEGLFDPPDSKTARWSLKLKYANGTEHTLIQDGSYLSEAGRLLDAIDDYFDNDSLESLKVSQRWSGISEEEITNWPDLF